MTNEQKANELAVNFKITANDVKEGFQEKIVETACLIMAEWKDARFREQMREHEKKLLDIVDTLLSLSVNTHAGHEFGMSMFRNKLINKDI